MSLSTRCLKAALRDKPLPFATKELPFHFGTLQQNVSFVCPQDPDEVLLSISDEHYEKDKFLPYWTEHWPSSPVLISWLRDNLPAASSWICELGCGLGVLSAFLGSCECRAVPLDISYDACRFAYVNSLRAGVAPRCVCGDWRDLPLRRSFDVLIASDVLYEPRWIGPVLSCIDELLKAGGYALIADPCRKNWVPFKNEAILRNMEVKIVEREAIEGNNMVIEIALIRKRAA